MKRVALCGRLGGVVAPFGLSEDLSGAFLAVGAAVAEATIGPAMQANLVLQLTIAN